MRGSNKGRERFVGRYCEICGYLPVSLATTKGNTLNNPTPHQQYFQRTSYIPSNSLKGAPPRGKKVEGQRPDIFGPSGGVPTK